MPMKPLEHDRRYGELDQVMRAYDGQAADDTEDKPSAALTAYLRHTWHARPWALAAAETQLREYSRNPPGRVRLRLGEFYSVPDVGLPEGDIQAWLSLPRRPHQAQHRGRRSPAAFGPSTHWEWRARFPEAAQFLGGWFSQDMPDEFADHDAAITDYIATHGPPPQGAPGGRTPRTAGPAPGRVGLRAGADGTGHGGRPSGAV